jgi:acyl-CoA dehydrogenase
LDELKCAGMADQKHAKIVFDKLIWRHIAYIGHQGIRALVLSLAKARWLRAASLPDKLRGHLRMATRLSVGLALCADVLMVCMGQKLKRQEHLSASLGDVLSDLYAVACVLQYHQQSQDAGAVDQLMVDVSCHDLLYHAQISLQDLLAHVPKGLAWILQALLFPWGKPIQKPKDTAWLALYQNMVTSPSGQQQLYFDVLDSHSQHPALRAYQALEQIRTLRPIEKKWRDAMKDQKQSHLSYDAQISFAQSKGLISNDEAGLIEAGRVLRMHIVSVNAFDPDEL